MQFEINLTQQGQDAKAEVLHTCTLEIDFLASVPTLGLSLAQGKSILKELQAAVVVKQIEQLAAGERICKHCGRARNLKDYHDIHYRSLFGDVVCRMPRWSACRCDVAAECHVARKRQRWFSAEMEFIQSQLAATIPYARSADLLSLLLPVSKGNAASTVREHALATGQRLDAQGVVAVTQPDQLDLRESGGPTIVGLDSGYVRHSHPDPQQSFEVVVGRAMKKNYGQRSVAFVRIVDDKAKERMRGMLSHFGGPEQLSEVFTDGDAALRQWQQTTLPDSSHVLDWYHLKTRIAKLNSVVHSRQASKELKPSDHDRISSVAGRLKWRLWHGRSTQVVEGLKSILRMTQRPSLLEKPVVKFVRKLTRDLIGYLQNNADSLPDYGKRYRSGQRISSAFVESTVNQLIDKRMSKSQQMRWDPQSAHQLLQVRVRVVDGQLRDDFSNWYPGFPQNDSELRLTA